MKVILLQDVKSIGKKNQVVEVSDGYAQNYLIPRRLAVKSTSKGLEVRDRQNQDEKDKAKIVFLFFKHQSLGEINLRKLGYQNMKMKNQIAYVIFTLKMLKECGVDDCPMFVNEMLNTDDNKIAFVIKQKEKNTYTISLRSKEGYNVAKIAGILGGGGHTQAAGCAFSGAPVRHAEMIYKECLKEINKVELKG